MLNFENLDKLRFYGVGEYDFPAIQPIAEVTPVEWIPFNYAKTEKAPAGKGIHFFLDDYQFNRVWNRPDDYTNLLMKFDYVCSPDFSTYTDMPKAMQIYNHYRKHWVAAYWQTIGINVVPTISWSDEKSFDWCFDGEPENSPVAVSTVGCMKNKAAKAGFLAGYAEMVKRLHPSTVIFYGQKPEEIEADNIITIEPHYTRFEKIKQ